MNYEKVLDDWIKYQRKASQMGSGDDLFYEMQIEEYVNKQRSFWIDFIKFVELKIKKK